MNERNKQNRDAVRQMTSGQTPAEVEAQKSLTTANPDWITPDDKKSPRQQSHASRRGVKRARESLARAAQDKLSQGFSKKVADREKDKQRWKATSGMKIGTKQSNPKPNQKADFNNRSFKTLTTSTELVKNGRMALAEKVLEAFQKGLKDKARAIQQASPGTRNQSAVDQAARATGDATIKKSQGKNTPRSMFGGNSNQTSTTAGGGTLGQELAKTKPESQHSMNRRGSSTVDKKKVAANLANAKSGKNAASLEKEIAADTEKRRAAKRAEG